MASWIVTVILNKVPGRLSDHRFECPLHGGRCTAPWGRHHSMLIEAESATAAEAFMQEKGLYVARVESI